ncbi:hypothetical protein BLNAU_6858 [Blattamonas nauphoetae]|uniref:Uncharacterized protein n=1 Tax=Blattamonas nauphoetae TaxID=2049346 RepID=A0ABQ9Y346_9EUKA|nr:hypothetical protein BLNAU_6858 [Blattamonas nauphoetae]
MGSTNSTLVERNHLVSSRSSPTTPPAKLPRNISSIKTIPQLISAMNSISMYIAQNGVIDDKEAKIIVSFLLHLSPRLISQFSSTQIIDLLITNGNSSSPSFRDDLITLLTCSHHRIVCQTLDILSRTINRSSIAQLIELQESGFFSQLPCHFQQDNMHLMNVYGFLLMGMIHSFVKQQMDWTLDAHLKTTPLGTSQVQNLLNYVLRPTTPFLNNMLLNFRIIPDSETSFSYPRFLGVLLQIAPLTDQTSEFILSFPLCIAFTSNFVHFHNETLLWWFINEFSGAVATWRLLCDDEQNARGRCLLRTLLEEGIIDHLEPFATPGKNRRSAQSTLRLFGGNISDVVSVI